MQAGLSWITILRKRDHFREVFDQFDPVKVAAYDDAKIASLLTDPGIIRNRAKILAAVGNAKSFLAVQKEFGTFDRYIWDFVGGKPIQNTWGSLREIPAKTAEAEKLSKDLAKRGFKFVGTTICYAYMQATGMTTPGSRGRGSRCRARRSRPDRSAPGGALPRISASP